MVPRIHNLTKYDPQVSYSTPWIQLEWCSTIFPKSQKPVPLNKSHTNAINEFLVARLNDMSEEMLDGLLKSLRGRHTVQQKLRVALDDDYFSKEKSIRQFTSASENDGTEIITMKFQNTNPRLISEGFSHTRIIDQTVDEAASSSSAFAEALSANPTPDNDVRLKMHREGIAEWRIPSYYHGRDGNPHELTDDQKDELQARLHDAVNKTHQQDDIFPAEFQDSIASLRRVCNPKVQETISASHSKYMAAIASGPATSPQEEGASQGQLTEVETNMHPQLQPLVQVTSFTHNGRGENHHVYMPEEYETKDWRITDVDVTVQDPKEGEVDRHINIRVATRLCIGKFYEDDDEGLKAGDESYQNFGLNARGAEYLLERMSGEISTHLKNKISRKERLNKDGLGKEFSEILSKMLEGDLMELLRKGSYRWLSKVDCKGTDPKKVFGVTSYRNQKSTPGSVFSLSVYQGTLPSVVVIDDNTDDD